MMYVVGYYNFFDNQVTLEKVEADSATHAASKAKVAILSQARDDPQHKFIADGSIKTMQVREFDLSTGRCEPLPSAEQQKQVRNGVAVAKAVWRWLQNQKQIQYVPWVLNPTSDRFDPTKAAEQKVHDDLMTDLERCIMEAVA